MAGTVRMGDVTVTCRVVICVTGGGECACDSQAGGSSITEGVGSHSGVSGGREERDESALKLLHDKSVFGCGDSCSSVGVI